MRLTKCPYCGKQMGYLKAFFTRNQGEYVCKKCKKESNVVINKGVFIPFIVAVVFALFILLAFFMLTDKENLWFMFFVAIPFLIFYLFTPFFVELKPKKKLMDSLYDTDMVDSSIATPDPTMAKKKRVTPSFIDDVILDDEDSGSSIDADIFEAIKNDRKAVAEVDGGTKPISSYENISSQDNSQKTMYVENLKSVTVKSKETPKFDDDVKIHNKNQSSVNVIKSVKKDSSSGNKDDEKIQELRDVIDNLLSTDDMSVDDIDVNVDIKK